MLIAAKHLLFLIGNKRKQIPSLRSGQAFRSAPDDNASICSKLLAKPWWVCVPWLLASCSRAPSFDILGSFFPAWLVCLAVSIVLTFLARWLLLRLHIAIVVPILVYPSLTALFAFALWLIFFR